MSEEDREIEVCVGISSPSVVDLSVIATLSTSDDTAKGTPMCTVGETQIIDFNMLDLLLCERRYSELHNIVRASR